MTTRLWWDALWSTTVDRHCQHLSRNSFRFFLYRRALKLCTTFGSTLNAAQASIFFVELRCVCDRLHEPDFKIHDTLNSTSATTEASHPQNNIAIVGAVYCWTPTPFLTVSDRSTAPQHGNMPLIVATSTRRLVTKRSLPLGQRVHQHHRLPCIQTLFNKNTCNVMR